MNLHNYYFVSEHKYSEFQHLLSNYPFLAIQLEDYNEGYNFYYHFVYNLYTYLTMDDYELIMDDNIRFYYPFQSYIHELTIKQSELQKFKKRKSNNHLYCLLFSVLLKNKLKQMIQKLVDETGFVSELPLELINFYENNPSTSSPSLTINQIHIQFLSSLKAKIIVDTYFSQLITDSIDRTNRYYFIHLKEF
ncbi:hypothetical protein B857_03522 [Solibacillus isronensis B3W22]|uniref:Uncharacterized protein n=1 Tax=Solibacillus isronensis B3W22 TaxID=1224748 RepID=K1LGR1_9BACL|nr:hypothetical protein [Solibacillus isronensis]AMO85107.1 hypothetical protein SOLI23_05765 [Solibacillus silvestris]EKB43684.1 hypothetical protein B857_03522 [Solibacillus isronensis B3W22]